MRLGFVDLAYAGC